MHDGRETVTEEEERVSISSENKVGCSIVSYSSQV